MSDKIWKQQYQVVQQETNQRLIGIIEEYEKLGMKVKKDQKDKEKQSKMKSKTKEKVQPPKSKPVKSKSKSPSGGMQAFFSNEKKKSHFEKYDELPERMQKRVDLRKDIITEKEGPAYGDMEEPQADHLQPEQAQYSSGSEDDYDSELSSDSDSEIGEDYIPRHMVAAYKEVHGKNMKQTASNNMKFTAGSDPTKVAKL